MTPSDGPLRLVRDAATVMALVVTGVFAALILILPNPPISLHEIAGVLLLLLLAVAILAGRHAGRSNAAPLARLWCALAVLIAVGVTGALLATGDIPPSFSSAPLVGLLVLAGLLVDALRVRALRPTGES